MELDTDIKAMIDAALALPSRPLTDITVAQFRDGYRDRYRARSVAPDMTVKTTALRIGDMPATAYRPASADGPLPLVVYFHGGGFVLGDAAAYDAQSRCLAARGACVLLFVDYRLAPEHPFPAALDDAWAAVTWAVAGAADLGADPARLAVAGDSAGGNLAANLCLMARDRGGPAIALQVLLYPWVDARPYAGGPGYPSTAAFAERHFLDQAVMEWFAGHYLPDRMLAGDPRVSPLLAPSHANLPPAIILTASHDPLRDMGAAYAARLITSGIDVDYRCVPGMVHNFLGHAGISPAAAGALTALGDLLRARLGL